MTFDICLQSQKKAKWRPFTSIWFEGEKCVEFWTTQSPFNKVMRWTLFTKQNLRFGLVWAIYLILCPDPNVQVAHCTNRDKGSLILGLKSPKTKVPNHYHEHLFFRWIVVRTVIWHLSEIKSPLKVRQSRKQIMVSSILQKNTLKCPILSKDVQYSEFRSFLEELRTL